MSDADCTSTAPHTTRCGQRHRPCHQCDIAPASCAARAMAKPILPLDRLVMPRTGSMASKVGPAVTSTCCPPAPWAGRMRSRPAATPAAPTCGHHPFRHRPGRPCPHPIHVQPSAAIAPHCAGWPGGPTSRGSWRVQAAAAHCPRARQAHQAQQVIGAAVHQFGHKVCAARRNQNGIGLTAQVDMRHVVGSRASHCESQTGRLERACMVTGVMNCLPPRSSPPAPLRPLSTAPGTVRRPCNRLCRR
jgi:hypothetical protein